MFGMKILNFIDGQLFVYFQLFAYFFQICHLEASNTKTAQNKDVWIECLESNYISCGRSLREFLLLLRADSVDRLCTILKLNFGVKL